MFFYRKYLLIKFLLRSLHHAIAPISALLLYDVYGMRYKEAVVKLLSHRRRIRQGCCSWPWRLVNIKNKIVVLDSDLGLKL